MREKKKNGGWIGLCVLAILLLILIGITFYGVWMNFNYIVVKVVETSMLDTLQDGDYLYVKPIERTQAQRGDVVIIDVSKHEGAFREGTELIIKRLIAVGGDAVKCEDGVVSIMYAGTQDWLKLDEPYVHYTTPDFETVEVGEGEIFFLGDHRNSSIDSADEEVGCLNATDLVGVVPQWAIGMKRYSTAWEGFRNKLYESFHS